ncbi:hypothetical protein COOONC_24523 [Cooperia oncophora]
MCSAAVVLLQQAGRLNTDRKTTLNLHDACSYAYPAAYEMNSIAGSVEAEDWLDISDSLSLPSLSLDDVLNEVSQLDDELLDGHLSGSVDHISPPPSAAASYKLDSAVKTERLDSHLLTNWSLFDSRSMDLAVAVAYPWVVTLPV